MKLLLHRLIWLSLALLAAGVLAACGAPGAAVQVTPFPTQTAASVAEASHTAEAPSDTPTASPADASPSAAAEATRSEPATPAPADTAPPPPTPTPAATATPTSVPQVAPTSVVQGTGSMREGVPTPPTAIPSPVPTFEMPEGVTNILLLGKDANADGQTTDTRTDTMIIVSVNRETQTASMISLPRDLYVYLPGRIMSRLNTAVTLGGPDLLKQAILYNFGIPIHYYAQVDFDGFKQIVDLLGGVEMAVSCPLEDWRLKSPELDPLLEENWERFKLEAGIHQMDGDLALWYARSRLTTTDYDRGRRQQQLLHAMLNQGVDLGLVARAPELWGAYSEVVETDMDIGRVLQLASIAPAVAEAGLQHLYLAGKMQAWSVPESGAAVQLPVWEGENMMQDTFRRLFLPPALNRADRAPITVEVINASRYPAQARLAADNLAWYGFAPTIGEPLPEQERTEVAYFGENFKGSYEWLLGWVMDQSPDNITLSEEASEFNYRVIIGNDYNACRPAFDAPQEAPSES
jgi:LCP family protein required for cell wall assembly